MRQAGEIRRSHELEMRGIQAQIEKQIAAFSKEVHSEPRHSTCSECAFLRARVSELESASHGRENTSQLKSELMSLSSQNRMQQTTIRELQSACDQLKAKEQALVSTLETLEQQHAEVDQARAQAVTHYTNAQAILRDLVTEHKKLQNEISRLQAQAGDAAKERDIGEKAARDLRVILDKTRQEHEFDRSELAAAKIRIAQLTALIEQTRDSRGHIDATPSYSNPTQMSSSTNHSHQSNDISRDSIPSFYPAPTVSRDFTRPNESVSSSNDHGESSKRQRDALLSSSSSSMPRHRENPAALIRAPADTLRYPYDAFLSSSSTSASREPVASMSTTDSVSGVGHREQVSASSDRPKAIVQNSQELGTPWSEAAANRAQDSKSVSLANDRLIQTAEHDRPKTSTYDASHSASSSTHYDSRPMTAPITTPAANVVKRGVITNRETDFNIFTGEPRGQDTELEEKRRALNTPATRMFWNTSTSAPKDPHQIDERSTPATDPMDAVNAVLERAKNIRLQQRAMTASNEVAASSEDHTTIAELKRQRDDLQRRHASQNLTTDEKLQMTGQLLAIEKQLLGMDS